MAENATALEDDDEQSGGGAQRQRSTIGFPYSDFESAAAVAQAIHGNVGHGTCSATAQLAPWMGQSPKSSSFRTQLAAARLFGLIESENAESYKLTPLGTRVVDPAQARAAKAESFLKVPLFAALFETAVRRPVREVQGRRHATQRSAGARDCRLGRVGEAEGACATGVREFGDADGIP